MNCAKQMICGIFADLINYVKIPPHVNRMYKSQHLLINIGYLLGTVPFRFDCNTGKLVDIDSWWQRYRWYASTTTSLLVKVLMILSLIKDISVRNFRSTYPPDMLRIIIIVAFSCFGLMDLHTVYKRTEIIATLNSSQEYYHRFQCKIIQSKLNVY